MTWRIKGNFLKFPAHASFVTITICILIIPGELTDPVLIHFRLQQLFNYISMSNTQPAKKSGIVKQVSVMLFGKRHVTTCPRGSFTFLLFVRKLVKMSVIYFTHTS